MALPKYLEQEIVKLVLGYSGNNNNNNVVSEWTELNVTMTAAQILNCGSSAIEILPAPGVGKYYVYEIDLKKPATTTVVNGNGIDYFYLGTDTYEGNIMQVSDYNSVANVVFQYESRNGINTNLPTNIIPVYPITINERIIFTTYNGQNPSVATGNVSLSVRYKILNF